MIQESFNGEGYHVVWETGNEEQIYNRNLDLKR